MNSKNDTNVECMVLICTLHIFIPTKYEFLYFIISYQNRICLETCLSIYEYINTSNPVK